ncbi:TIGR03621 family F420-dependent LLM class oxidoreductase [Kineococcus glutinatus]|uniref:TIGR03621 family F420-dependent LLM class oxidoreductase n=1 Tax=Kineococcus glutinatus TaxID=1070872 RepID=A0ABP9I8P6_9ACTN
MADGVGAGAAGGAGFEFGVNVGRAASRAGFADVVRRAGEAGFDVIAAPDHLGCLSPFVSLATAASLDPRLRLRTYVLDAGFWNAALLARDVATLDVLSGGRVELGVGAGHVRDEHEDAGVRWGPLAERVRWMEDLLVEVRRRLADEAHSPRPVQRPVPLVVGAMSRAGLAVAARHADVVAFPGALQVRGERPGTLRLATAEEVAERVAHVREAAAGRPHRCDVLLQLVALDPDPERVAAELVAGDPHTSAADALASPACLFATDAADGAAQLRRRSAEFGFTAFSTHDWNLDALGRVVAELRRPPGPAGPVAAQRVG